MRIEHFIFLFLGVCSEFALSQSDDGISGTRQWFDGKVFDLATLNIGDAEYRGKAMDFDGKKIEVYRGFLV